MGRGGGFPCGIVGLRGGPNWPRPSDPVDHFGRASPGGHLFGPIAKRGWRAHRTTYAHRHSQKHVPPAGDLARTCSVSGGRWPFVIETNSLRARPRDTRSAHSPLSQRPNVRQVGRWCDCPGLTHRFVRGQTTGGGPAGDHRGRSGLHPAVGAQLAFGKGNTEQAHPGRAFAGAHPGRLGSQRLHGGTPWTLGGTGTGGLGPPTKIRLRPAPNKEEALVKGGRRAWATAAGGA